MGFTRSWLGFPPGQVVTLTLTASTFFLLYLYWRERRNTKRLLSLSREAATRVLFFPDTETKNQKRAEQELCDALDSATNSLDVCVYAISNWRLIDILISAHRRGVAVRVVSDKDQVSVNPSPVEKLRRNGVQVRHNHDSYLMHHKFAVVDRRCLVNGSLNWTQQAVHGNQENVSISYSYEVVRQFLDQFELLWEQFHPRNYCTTDLLN